MIKLANNLKVGDSIAMKLQKLEPPFEYELYTYVINEIIKDGPMIRMTSTDGDTLSFAKTAAVEVLNE